MQRKEIRREAMAINYQTCLDGQLLCVRFQGNVRLSDITAYWHTLLADPEVSSSAPRLIDVRGMDLPPTTAEIRDIAETLWHPSVRTSARRAVLATRDVVYGMFRMLEVMAEREGHARPLRTFRDARSAYDWLGIANGPPSDPCILA